MSALLKRAVGGEALGRAEAADLLRAFADGQLPAEALAALLTALAIRGETPEVLAGFAEVARERLVAVPFAGAAVDLCGTGGDGQGTVNLSTAAAFVAAGAGATVAKHGNRAVSGSVGSADVLETLGLGPVASPDEEALQLASVGLSFLYAPAHHPLFAQVAPVRRALGFRTAFNLLGPLCNPARVRRQVVGVPSAEAQRAVAGALALLGTERAWVVFTEGPYDEVSLTAPSRVLEVRGGRLEAFELAPEDFGAQAVRPADLVGGDADHNAARVLALLSGEPSPLADAVCANAACALVVAGEANSVEEGFAAARAALRSGAALGKLEALRARKGERGELAP